MKVFFVLSKKAIRPIGGYKMVYEYANALAIEGDDVTILYDYAYSLEQKKYIPKCIKKKLYKRMYQNAQKWFTLNDAVKERIVWKLTKEDLEDADIVIATAAQTAKSVAMCAPKEKVYFVQGYENWIMDENELKETYALYSYIIVISNWLQKKIESLGFSATVVKNGIDLKNFYNEKPYEFREKHSLSYMYHIDVGKGVSEGLKAIEALKEKYPDLSVKMFGAYPKGSEVPDWIEYTESATPMQLRKIYNETRVFLSTSHEEGFGLTGAESMACGCVLVSTRTNGALEYVEDRKNAVLVDVGDVRQMIDCVSQIFENEERAKMLTKEAQKTMKSLTIDISRKKFVNYLYSLEVSRKN